MGGNVQIGAEEASRIDLKKFSRTEVVSRVLMSLDQINMDFKKSFGFPLWNPSLFKSLNFLSGSAKHFMNVSGIDTKAFVDVKSSVGDIDLQVDIKQEPQIEKYLNGLNGKSFGDMKYIGYKKSAGQFITLWKSSAFGINIQMDFELVDFIKGKPTQWATFSHSSHWADMTNKIKGVFQKYALRALSTKSLRDVVVLKGKKKTPKVVTSTDLAFSVMKGVREKLKPVLDQSGNIVKTNGLETFEEISTSDSTYVTELDVMFKMFFGHKPTRAELNKFSSFVGIIELIKANWAKTDIDKFVIGFANTLWGAGAQELYRNDPDKDYEEKITAYNYMLNVFGMSSPSEVEKWKVSFYQK